MHFVVELKKSFVPANNIESLIQQLAFNGHQTQGKVYLFISYIPLQGNLVLLDDFARWKHVNRR